MARRYGNALEHSPSVLRWPSWEAEKETEINELNWLNYDDRQDYLYAEKGIVVKVTALLSNEVLKVVLSAWLSNHMPNEV